MAQNILSEKTEINVRFSEVDSMAIVWHGNYIKFFEDGREAFGRKYGISYMDIKSQGFMAPLIDMKCQFKKVIKYGDKVYVKTTFRNTSAAKIIYEFEIRSSETDELLTSGETTQVFMTFDGELHLTIPKFFSDWKKKWGYID
ncbi:MAG: acyl-CoA thioesterase [Bacteroidales bacterium]|nr:acyl-CoA thioesterase [Bacteroidales bacterium]